MSFEAIPSAQNYQVGGIIITLNDGEQTIDLGCVAGFGMDPSGLDVLEHFCARSGVRQKDRVVIIKQSLKFTAKLDEHHPDIYAIVFMGDRDGNIVHPMTRPLAEFALSIVYRNLAGVIWTFTADRCTVKSSGASDFGDFSSWAEMEVEIEILKSADGESVAPFGAFEFEA